MSTFFDENLEKFGERLEIIINNNNLDRKKFGEIIGITGSGKVKSTVVGKYILGSVRPKLTTLNRISKEFNVSLHWLLTGQGEKDLKQGGNEGKLIELLEYKVENLEKEVTKWKNRYLEVQADLTTLQNEQREAAEQKKANQIFRNTN